MAPTVACLASVGLWSVAGFGGGLSVEMTGVWAAAPWLVALLVFGMPHGAADWAVHAARLCDQSIRVKLYGFAPYLAYMGVSAFCLWVLPVVTIAAFFVLTAVHFGMADVNHALGDAPGTRRAGPSRLLGLSRGVLVLSVPFAIAPSAAWAPFALLSGVPLDAAPVPMASLRAACFALSLSALVALCVAMALIRPSSWRQPRVWFALESACAMVLFAFTPPLFAVGVYFLFVHALKHTFRLAHAPSALGLRVAKAPEEASLADQAKALCRVHLSAMPLWPLSVVIILVWASALPPGLTALSIAAASIGFYIVTTLPHHRLGRFLPPHRG
ncbi:MAG: Brp/Blh family beta-carotene 15,15'-dioxygenase [Planctomycetota bacterium]